MAEVRNHFIKPGETLHVPLQNPERDSYALEVFGPGETRIAVCVFTCTEVEGPSVDTLHVKVSIFPGSAASAYNTFYLNPSLKTPFGVTLGNTLGITAVYEGDHIVFEMMAPADEKKDSDGN